MMVNIIGVDALMEDSKVNFPTMRVVIRNGP